MMAVCKNFFHVYTGVPKKPHSSAKLAKVNCTGKHQAGVDRKGKDPVPQKNDRLLLREHIG